MVVIEEFSTEFQIQLTAELSDPVADLLRLHLHVFFIAKTLFKHTFHAPFFGNDLSRIPVFEIKKELLSNIFREARSPFLTALCNYNTF